MNKNDEVNSHFIQKALVKNFANNGIVNYIKYPNEEASFFDIRDWNSRQPIAEKGFYSMEIETGMNNLEREGITVIRKIAKNSQFQEEVSLNRRELITLKCYSLLSGVRTQKLRDNISNQTGDSLFNMIMEQENAEPKEIQEKMIECVLEYWNSNKNGMEVNIYEEMAKDITDRIKWSCLMRLDNTMKSRLLIFKFESKNLLLTEALNFTEQNRVSGGILLSFMPIFANIGIAFYFDPILMRGSKITTQKSEIFQNDISIIRHKNEYVNEDLMKEKQTEYLRNSRSIESDNILYWSTEAKKYHDKDDKYIYEVLMEPESTAILCNAMALVHCRDNYVIFQKEEDIREAEKMVVKKNIFRVEDFV